jgi:hypothetical protein
MSSRGICKVEGFHGREPHQKVDDCTDWTPIPPNPDQSLRERFRNVIRLAGYAELAQDRILEQWYDFYMNGDRTEFVKMLEKYEQSDGDPIDDEREHQHCNRHNDLGCRICIKNNWGFGDGHN